MSFFVIIGEVFRFIIRLFLIPVQVTLTLLILVIGVAEGLLSRIFGLLGGVITLGALFSLFQNPVDWKVFLIGLVMGSLIGAFPRIVCSLGDSVLMGMKTVLSKV